MLKKIILSSSLITLVACGGGGGRGDAGDGVGDEKADVKTGVIESLAGVTYRTETQSGMLSSTGEFKYIEGETLTLLLGKTVIAEQVVAESTTLNKTLNLDKLPTTPLAVRSALRMPEYTRDRIQTGYLIEKTVGQYNDLHKASNIMRLLIALDNDNDSSNGFDITDNNTAIQDLNVNLNTSLYEFTSNDDVMAFQHDTGISLAMNVARPLMDAYALADIALTVPARVKQGDQMLTYTAQDQVANISEEQSSDSITEQAFTYSAENGEWLTFLYTVNPNSDASSYIPSRQLTTNTYNAFGLLTTERKDMFTRGNVSQLASYKIKTNSYTDDKVYLASQRTVDYSDAVGTVDRSHSIRTTYNDAKKRTSSSTFSGDTTETEVFEYGTKSYEYDEKNRLTKTEYENTNSNTESSYEYIYSESEGNLVTTQMYNRSNGTKREIKETINPAGQLILKETKELNADSLATSFKVMTYSYDEQGRISQCHFKQDTNADGTEDSITTSNLVYTAAGLHKISNTYDTNADGTADSELEKTVTYGDDGEVVLNNLGKSSSTYTYGNAAKNGISYLVYEYQNPALGGDKQLHSFYNSSIKCEVATTNPRF